ncbi:MAG: methylenetetrahydrofolate reductase [NAD(P)H] [Verrucomicrobia bacterium]|nr:methylenetetrahydrofolate reductase [NAD(P)H] [Verrucomicrobiota bacterium]
MHIDDIFARDATTFSFEFFPPKTAQSAEQLFATIKELEALSPSFVDVTYGAGGATRDLTHDLVLRIHRECKTTSIPHLTTVCQQESEIRELMEKYTHAGVSNILALGGDPPRDKPNWDRSQDTFRYASDLVAYIKRFNDEGIHADPRGFGIGVAAYPEGHPATPNRLKEMDYLKRKVDAGADYIVTQLFFDNGDFYDFRERCERAGIHIPILAGLMPITSFSGMIRMAELAAGTRYPAALLRAVDRCCENDDAVKRVGIHWATQQCLQLLEHGVRGVHFYTLNHSDASRQIYQTLGLHLPGERHP